METTKEQQAAKAGIESVDAAAKKVAVADIVHFGDKITLPVGMGIPAAIDVLLRREQYLEEEMDMIEVFDVFPWDGAVALNRCLQAKYGWASAEPTPGFFGPKPPQLISVDIGPDEVISVPWGRFSMPGVTGHINCGMAMKSGHIAFQIHAHIKRKDESVIRDMFTRIRQELKDNSIYRGKAIKIRFEDDNGEDLAMPEPKFINVESIKEESLIYSKPVMDAVETNLFTPIRRISELAANNIKVKRGILLGGTFGTGKTLAAFVAAKLATQQGMTYIYVPRADELPQAIEFAKQYQTVGAVVFCEDIDRVADGERTVEMDDMLNLIDGIDTKTAKIMVVLTTNNLNGINAALLRPGRLDAVINIEPPDAETVVRLIHFYGDDTIDPAADLTPIGVLLQGQIPAVIAEVVHRAKLAQLRLQPPGQKVTLISARALMDASKSMGSQLKLLQDRIDGPTVKPTLEQIFSNTVTKAVEDTMTGTRVREIHQRVM